MFRRALTWAAAVMILCLSQAAYAGLDDFAGTWKNVDRDTRGITTLKINVRGKSVRLQAWGACEPEDCDWGRVRATAYGPGISADLRQSASAISAVFKQDFAETFLYITRHKGDRISVNSLTRFTDNSGRSNYVGIASFKRDYALRPGHVGPVKPVHAREDCVSFNWRNIRVRQIDGRWKIVDGTHWIMDFGPKRNEARQAHRIMRHYRMTSMCFVGRPDPSFTYFLSEGEAPAGAMSGEDSIAFNPYRIAVRNVNNRWKITEGNHWIFDFGHNEREALQALALIKKYGFTHTCYVGRPNSSMTYMRK